MTPDLQRGMLADYADIGIIRLSRQYDNPLGFKHTRQGLWICGQVLRTSPRPADRVDRTVDNATRYPPP